MNKQEFIKFVDDYSDHDESVLGDILNILTNKYNRMVQREKKRRDSAHLKGAMDLLSQIWSDKIYKKNPKLFDKTTCCSLLDAISEVYPNIHGGSLAGIELLEHYAKSVRALGWEPEDDFIRDIREKSDWLKKLYAKY